MRGAILALLLVGVAVQAHADAIDPRLTCPRQPPTDGAACARGMSCRYPQRGIVCTCARVPVGDAHPRQWTCGELGE